MRKLVTHFSLRLGLELSGEKNCIGFHPILSDCKRRNPQNLAGSVPNVPTSANILIQKKEQKSLLLEFVIDFAFACLLLRRLGNNEAGVIGAKQQATPNRGQSMLAYFAEVRRSKRLQSRLKSPFDKGGFRGNVNT